MRATVSALVLLVLLSTEAKPVHKTSDEWTERDDVDTGDVKVFSHVLVFSKIQLCIQGVTADGVDSQYPTHMGGTTNMATDQKTTQGVPIANRGCPAQYLNCNKSPVPESQYATCKTNCVTDLHCKDFLSCAQRSYNYKSPELSKLLLGSQKEVPVGVGVFINAEVAKQAQAQLALGLGGDEAKVCMQIYNGPDCSGEAQAVESAQHRCNSESTILPAQTDVLSLGSSNGMALQCAPSVAPNARRLLGTGTTGMRNASHIPDLSQPDLAEVMAQISTAREIAKQFRHEAELLSITQIAQEEMQANMDMHNGDKLLDSTDEVPVCSYSQRSDSLRQQMPNAATRKLQGTTNERAGCGIITTWTPRAAGSADPDAEPANICDGVFHSREGFELGQCIKWDGKPCEGATSCIKVQCSACSGA